MKKSILLLVFVSLFLYGCNSEPTNQEISNVDNKNKILHYQLLWEDFIWDESTKKVIDDVFKNKLFIEYIEANVSTSGFLKVWQIWWVNLNNKTWWDEFTLDENLFLYVRTSWTFKTTYSSWYVVNCDKNNKFYKEEKLDDWKVIAVTCDWDIWEYQEKTASREFFSDTIIDIVVENNGEEKIIKWSNWERVERVKKWP